MRSILLAIFLSVFCHVSMGQLLKPAMDGLFHNQIIGGAELPIKFRANGPLGKDWIYGQFLDKDSVLRYVAYRSGGKWVPLPIKTNYIGAVNDLAMWGDTMCIGGDMRPMEWEKDSSTVAIQTNLLMYHQDSFWSGSDHVWRVKAMATKGDSLLIAGAHYHKPPQAIIGNNFMTVDGAQTWQYPFSITHPTDTGQYPSFGIHQKTQILDNGDILKLNDEGPVSSAYKGLIRWDGQQWHSYGNYPGSMHHTAATEFEFYNGELYLGGSFGTYGTFYGDTIWFNPNDPPVNSIARWDGTDWQGLGGGIMEGGVRDIIEHDSILYVFIGGGIYSHHKFGDVHIPSFAGWDGEKWCGTPLGIDNLSATPERMGFINDTLYLNFSSKPPYSNATVNGKPVDHVMYFDGDYLNGPNAICSTPTIGQAELKKEGAIMIYPNPAKEVLYVNLPQNTERYNYELYSMDGRRLQQGALNKAQNKIRVKEGVLGPCVLQIIGVQNVYSVKVLFEK